MKAIYTIGFTKKSAEYFFELLQASNIKRVIDVRINNTSQLAGFAKARDLEYFLDKIGGIEYEHELIFSPTKDILDSYKKNQIVWEEYETLYSELMEERNIVSYIKEKGLEHWASSCLLCSEDKPDNCHRSLAASKIIEVYPELQVVNLE